MFILADGGRGALALALAAAAVAPAAAPPRRRAQADDGRTLADDAAALLAFRGSGDPSAWPAAVAGWPSDASVCEWGWSAPARA